MPHQAAKYKLYVVEANFMAISRQLYKIMLPV